MPLASSAQKLCPCSARPAPPFALALPLTKFALTSSSLPFHLASSSSSSSSSLSRFFAAAQLSRVSVLINVDSGFLFAVAVAYTRVYLVGGIKGANNLLPPLFPPLPRNCRARRVCCVFAFIGNIIFDFAGNLISSSAAVQHSRSR